MWEFERFPHTTINQLNKYYMKKRTKQEQAAYENACVCLYYGFSRKHWNSCGLSEEDAIRIWKDAFHYMAEEA